MSLQNRHGQNDGSFMRSANNLNEIGKIVIGIIALLFIISWFL
jgi:hypothetical protein